MRASPSSRIAARSDNRNAAAQMIVVTRLMARNCGVDKSAGSAGRRVAQERAERVADRGADLPAWEPFRSAVEGGLARLEDTLEVPGEDAADAVLAGA